MNAIVHVHVHLTINTHLAQVAVVKSLLKRGKWDRHFHMIALESHKRHVASCCVPQLSYVFVVNHLLFLTERKSSWR